MTLQNAGARTGNYRLFAGLCVGFFFAILLPVLLAGRPRNDDLIRSAIGSYGWLDNGRYLSNFLMRLLELGATRVTDIAPLPQLLAVAVLSYAGVVLVRRFDVKSVPLAILICLPLGTQPLFLENLSYRFDAVTMAAAMLCAIAAIGMRNIRGSTWLLGVVVLLASFNFYQPAFNVFLVFAVFECACELAREQSLRLVMRLMAHRASQAIVATLVYKLFFTSGIKDWVADHSETIHSISDLSIVGQNLLHFASYPVKVMGIKLTLIFLISIILASLPMIATGIRDLWRKRQISIAETCLRTALLLSWPVLAFLASIGPMLLLRDPVFAPRVFLGLGAWLSAALLSAVLVAQRSARWTFVPYTVGATSLFVSAITAGAYSSAASEQMKFEDRIGAAIEDDLAQLKTTAPLSRYTLLGSAGYAPAVQRAVMHVPVLEQLVQPYLTQDSVYTKFFLMHFRQSLDFVETTQLSELQNRAVFNACEKDNLVGRSVYRIRIVEDIAVVDFRDQPSCVK